MPLQGKGTEKGTYECHWNNSKGEARHRNFTVFPTFFVETTDVNINTNVIIITVTLIGLVLVAGTGFGIKFYLDKVRKLIDALNNSTQIHSLPYSFALKRKAEKELEAILNGDPSRIDPDVPMEYQTEFLPYDKKWEFPRKRLRLGLLS